MGVLEQVSQMRDQGIPEQEIVSRLQAQKISPKEINDALNQARIKEAVYSSQDYNMNPPEQMPMPENVEAPYAPKTQDFQEGTPREYVPQPQEEYAAPQEMYQQESYGYQPADAGQSSDMMIEISEQVFNEKIKKVERQIDKLTDAQVVLQTQTEHATERLKRIEAIMDKLETAILEKVGSYGKNLESIKKEMGMIENSFRKIIPHARKISHKIHPDSHTKTSKKKSKKK